MCQAQPLILTTRRRSSMRLLVAGLAWVSGFSSRLAVISDQRALKPCSVSGWSSRFVKMNMDSGIADLPSRAVVQLGQLSEQLAQRRSWPSRTPHDSILTQIGLPPVRELCAALFISSQEGQRECGRSLYRWTWRHGLVVA